MPVSPLQDLTFSVSDGRGQLRGSNVSLEIGCGCNAGADVVLPAVYFTRGNLGSIAWLSFPLPVPRGPLSGFGHLRRITTK